MLDITRIQKYNDRVSVVTRRLQEKKTEYEVKQHELVRLCEELTEELGTEVTPDNLEEIYTIYEQQVLNTLESGEELLTLAENELQEADSLYNNKWGADIAE